MPTNTNERYIEIPLRIALKPGCRQVHLAHLTELKAKLETTAEVFLEGVQPTPYEIEPVQVMGRYVATHYEF